MNYFFKLTLPFVILLVGCQKPAKDNTSPEQSATDKASEVVDKAIAWAGGMEKWKSLSTIDYSKRSRLLLENEEVEYDITQQHSYEMQPDFKMNIEWQTEEGAHRLVHSDAASTRFLNDSISAQGTKVTESAMSAFYVLGMPFKLKDPGTYLSYEGTTDFNGNTADVVKATYSPEQFDNHSTTDQWWYYFNEADGEFLGCMVYHPPTYARIENIAFHDVDGMKFQKRRMSYRCDSLGNKQFLRAEFWYEDYEIAFSEE